MQLYVRIYIQRPYVTFDLLEMIYKFYLLVWCGHRTEMANLYNWQVIYGTSKFFITIIGSLIYLPISF